MGSPTLNITAVATTNNGLVSVLLALINCWGDAFQLYLPIPEANSTEWWARGTVQEKTPGQPMAIWSLSHTSQSFWDTVQNGTSNVLFSSKYFDVYGIKTRSNPDISGLAFRVGSRAHSLFPAAALGGTDTFPLLWAWFGEEESGYCLWWKWLKEGRDGDLGQKAINQTIHQNTRTRICKKNHMIFCGHVQPWHLNFYILKNKVASARVFVLSNFNKP